MDRPEGSLKKAVYSSEVRSMQSKDSPLQVRWEQQFRQVLQDVLQSGEQVKAGASSSTGSNQQFIDFNNYQFTLPNPRDRILANPLRNLNLYSAIARFVWMCSGSDRIADIAFYEPQVKRFTDDQISVPGSNYGTRIFQPRPGLNQILAAVERLKKDQGTRRSAVIVWQPEDAVRESNDIPCTFGLSFYVRRGRLNVTTIMRSNAAFRLLPFNVFEFTLLGELVSVLTGIPLGEYTTFAVSMHIYESELPRVRQMLEAEDVEPCPEMDIMPSSTTWDDIYRLIEFSNSVRAATEGLTNYNYQEWLSTCDKLDPYWADFGKALLAFSLFKNNLIRAGNHVIDLIKGDAFRLLLNRHPMAEDRELQKLEENVVLLETRLNLLRAGQNYTELTLEERETLWRSWSKEHEMNTASAKAKYRDKALTEMEWERRIKELKAHREQEGPQMSLFSEE